MTEDKRFIYTKSEGGIGYAIYDTTKNYIFPNLPREYEAKVFCQILNKLYKKNEELKQENTELKSSIEKLYNKHIDEFFEYYDPTNENDKLKSELEEIYYTQVYEPVEPYDEEIHKMCRILFEAFNEGKNE